MTSRLRIVVGSDEAGYDYKEAIKGDLAADSRVAEVTDVGVGVDEDTAYPHVAVAAARLVAGAKPIGHCWSAAPAWVWRSAPTRCPAFAPSPHTTGFRSSGRCCRTTRKFYASVSA